MKEIELYWLKVSALSQVAAAAVTFLAVLVSLYIAFRGRRPRLKLKVGERLIMGGGADELAVLMFSVANAGERPVHVRGIGWRTGWLRWGPTFLKRRAAVQVTGGAGMGQDPPYELQPGAEGSSYALMENILGFLGERQAEPFYTRDWPLFGRRATSVRGYVYTADGYLFHSRPEKSLLSQLVQAEKRAKIEGHQIE